MSVDIYTKLKEKTDSTAGFLCASLLNLDSKSAAISLNRQDMGEKKWH